MSDSKKVTTAYGEIEVETVKCHRCEYETPVETARHALIPSDISDARYGNGIKIEWKSDGLERVFCPECAEAIFGEKPEPTYQRKLSDWMSEREHRFLLVFVAHLLMIACTAVVAVVVLIGPP